MKISKSEFIDEFMDRVYLNGNKEEDKYILTLSQAESAAAELYTSFNIEKKPECKAKSFSRKPKVLNNKIELSNLIREKITPIKFSEKKGNWEGDYVINKSLISLSFKYYANKKDVYNVDILHVNKDRTYKPLAQKEIKSLIEIIKNG